MAHVKYFILKIELGMVTPSLSLCVCVRSTVHVLFMYMRS